jgi:hypothetical protein
LKYDLRNYLLQYGKNRIKTIFQGNMDINESGYLKLNIYKWVVIAIKNKYQNMKFLWQRKLI